MRILALALAGLAGYAYGKGYFDRPEEEEVEKGLTNPTLATIEMDIPTRAALDIYVAAQDEPKPTREDVVARALHDWLTAKGFLSFEDELSLRR